MDAAGGFLTALGLFLALCAVAGLIIYSAYLISTINSSAKNIAGVMNYLGVEVRGEGVNVIQEKGSKEEDD